MLSRIIDSELITRPTKDNKYVSGKNVESNRDGSLEKKTSAKATTNMSRSKTDSWMIYHACVRSIV